MSVITRPVQQLIDEAKAQNRTLLAVLIDPDKADPHHLDSLLSNTDGLADLYFIGGSLVTENALDTTIRHIKGRSTVPCVLFPGSAVQVSPEADAILFISLISGRNPDLLIGQHVVAAPRVREFGLEVLPVGYMLVDGGRATTATYMSHSLPIPAHKPDIAACTGMAGEMLGLRSLYLDAGSGADKPVPADMIAAVRQHCHTPIIVGGGMRTPEQLFSAASAGANVVVVGNALESEPGLALEMKAALAK